MRDFVENQLEHAKKFIIEELLENGFLQKVSGTKTYYIPHKCAIILLCEHKHFRVKHVVEKSFKYFVKYTVELEHTDDVIGLSQAILDGDRFAVIQYVNE